MYHIQYTTQIWERIAFKIPSKTDCFCLPGLPFGFRAEEGAIVLANINQSHIKVFNRVLNDISSRSENNTMHARTHANRHTRRVLNSRKKKASIDATRRRGQSATVETWTPVRRVRLCKKTGS